MRTCSVKPKPKKVAAIIKSWLEDNGRELKALSERAKALAKPDSLFDIVKELDGMVARIPDGSNDMRPP